MCLISSLAREIKAKRTVGSHQDPVAKTCNHLKEFSPKFPWFSENSSMAYSRNKIGLMSLLLEHKTVTSPCVLNLWECFYYKLGIFHFSHFLCYIVPLRPSKTKTWHLILSPLTGSGKHNLWVLTECPRIVLTMS